ncbi:hypothetical protein FRB94_006527 [Tulasnella sp. JGI-2019a]|nr:hypothetical protein FRB93_004862 [Tulasnella sp. JGI-2019a]KAG8998910.1 hypothetical protein FRB94_006527 [Tulasnella sp. JGI-2019a]
MQWLPRLLDFLARCKTLKLSDISDLPLIPLMNGDIAISLAKAQERTVFTTFSIVGVVSPELLTSLNILVIRPVPGLPSKPPINLGTLMAAFRSLGKDLRRLNEGIPRAEWQSLTLWMKDSLGSLRNLSQPDRDTFLAIPIFEAQRGGRTSTKALLPTTEIHMLPLGVQLSSIARYLPQSTYFADYNFRLSTALYGRSNQMLSHDDMFQRLRLPPHITADEHSHFPSVLRVITDRRHGGDLPGRPFIPDMDGVLRKPEELYDHRVESFIAAFGSRQAKFVHRNYRTDIDSFVRVGVRKDLDAPTLITCVVALDEDVRRGGFDWDRATGFWAVFADSNAVRELQLNTIANFRFIPYNTHRHDIPGFAEFARPLQDPDVASPRELVRAEHAPVVWTQRACFPTSLPTFISMVMPDLGVPTTEQVVNHLEILATEIAPQYPRNHSLQHDLIKTYDWLRAHIREAGHYLAQRSNSLLWLNVTNWTDEWTWRSSKQLIFDLRYDDPQNGHYDVKDRLLPYKDLLMIAGAHEQARLTIPEGFAPEGGMVHKEGLCLGLDFLRQNGWMTDIQFEVGGEVIQAHRAVLAATMDHFRVALTSTYQEGGAVASDNSPMLFPTVGITSAFAMRSVVEYAYSGTFPYPRCETTEDAGPALEDLLALLDLSNMWMIDGVKNKTQRAIIELGLVRQETYREILQRAEVCGARVLVTACRTTEAQVARWR